MKVLVLDFDGVISDSAREAFVVALRTHCSLDPASPLHPILESLDPARPEDAPAYSRFLELMPLGNRAEDYQLALCALAQGVRIEDQRAYDAFKAAQDPERLREFHRHFYRVRAAWCAGDPAGWLRMMTPYRPFVELLQRRGPGVDLAIATAKDRGSVIRLLAHYGIAGLFPEDRVLDKETGPSKTTHLQHLHRVVGCGYPEMTFVDDKVNHLETVASLGVRCALAAWGYNAAREQERARELGFLVCTLEDAERELFGRS